MKPCNRSPFFRHARTEGAGYLGDFLDRHGLPWQLIAIDQGAAVPADPAAYSGLVFMGGPMSVNDDLPWLPPLFELIRKRMPPISRCSAIASVGS